MSDIAKYNPNNELELVSDQDSTLNELQKITYLIDSIRLELGQPALSKEIASKLAESWLGHFCDFGVPLDKLEVIYKLAIKWRMLNNHSYPFTIEDMLRGWKMYSDEEKQKALYPKKNKNCDLCQGSGRYEFVRDGIPVCVNCPNGCS